MAGQVDQGVHPAGDTGQAQVRACAGHSLLQVIAAAVVDGPHAANVPVEGTASDELGEGALL